MDNNFKFKTRHVSIVQRSSSVVNSFVSSFLLRYIHIYVYFVYMYISIFVLITFCVITIVIISIFTIFFLVLSVVLVQVLFHVSCNLKLYINFPKFWFVSRFNLYVTAFINSTELTNEFTTEDDRWTIETCLVLNLKLLSISWTFDMIVYCAKSMCFVRSIYLHVSVVSGME